jgi:hypothetical protein
MADSIVAVDTVTLIGGPAKVDVKLDFGPQGSRGSLILYGLGKPSTIAPEDFSFPPQLLDWYINLKTNDSEYQFLYQYQNKDGIAQWVKVFKIIPNVYNTNVAVTFTAGVATINLRISNTTAPLLGAGTPSLNAHVSIQTADVHPIVSNFAFGTPTFDQETQEYVLPLTISGAALDPSTGWGALSGAAIANISINVI